jgi:hypothetical protein
VNRVRRCIGCVVTGIAVSLCPALLLVWVYGWSMVPPGPGYYTRKLQFMFSMPDPGCGTWLGILGLLPGFVLICMGVVALFRPGEANKPSNPRAEIMRRDE